MEITQDIVNKTLEGHPIQPLNVGRMLLRQSYVGNTISVIPWHKRTDASVFVLGLSAVQRFVDRTFDVVGTEAVDQVSAEEHQKAWLAAEDEARFP